MATSTDVPLYTGTISGASTNTVTIPITNSNYTNLKVVVSTRTTNLPAILLLQMNGDTGTNYSHTAVGTAGSTAGSTRSSSQGAIYLSSYSHQNSTQSTYTFYVMNYSNTNMNKTVLVRGSNSSYGIDIAAGLWRSNSAVTSLTIFLDRAEYWAAGSTFSVYGVGSGINGAGGDSTSKASGGEVFEDSTYYYHLFKGAGTFKPAATLTADVLVLAGGGGGALASGGAGGLQYFSSQSLSAITYPVLVGAGGAAGHCGADGTTGIRGTQGGTSRFGALTASVGGGGGGALSSNSSIINGGDGGSGGGSGTNSSSGGGSGGTGTAGQGNNGGAGNHVPGVYLSSGGAGGAGGPGTSYSGATPGSPGPGVTTYSSFGLATSTGHNVSGTVWYASGGQQTSNTNRPNGGGGVGTNYQSYNNALPFTGSGGGCTYGPNFGGNGGSGVIIVRYAK